MAVGDLGLTRKEFERMTWGEFTCRYRGWIRRRERGLEDLRLLVWSGIAPHSRRRIRPQDIIKLPGDKREFERVDIDTYKAIADV